MVNTQGYPRTATTRGGTSVTLLGETDKYIVGVYDEDGECVPVRWFKDGCFYKQSDFISRGLDLQL